MQRQMYHAVRPLQLLKWSDKLLQFGGALIIKSGCFPPVSFANWNSRLPTSGFPHQSCCLSVCHLCFCLLFCRPWCFCSAPCDLRASILWSQFSVIKYIYWKDSYVALHNTYRSGSNKERFDLSLCTHTVPHIIQVIEDLKYASRGQWDWEMLERRDQTSLSSTASHLLFSPALSLSFALPFISILLPHEISLISRCSLATCKVILSWFSFGLLQENQGTNQTRLLDCRCDCRSSFYLIGSGDFFVYEEFEVVAGTKLCS